MKVNKVSEVLYSMGINESGVDINIDSLDMSNDYISIKTDLIKLISNSIDSSDITLICDFIESYLNRPDETAIEGLSNDTDFYDFYIKFTDDMDEMLNSISHFSTSPQKLDIFSVYGYTVKSSKICISSILNIILTELIK